MSKQDKNTDVTVYLKNGDTVTRNGVSDDDARRFENLAFTDPQVSCVNATKHGKRG
jgi:hypothetical protein